MLYLRNYISRILYEDNSRYFYTNILNILTEEIKLVNNRYPRFILVNIEDCTIPKNGSQRRKSISYNLYCKLIGEPHDALMINLRNDKLSISTDSNTDIRITIFTPQNKGICDCSSCNIYNGCYGKIRINII